MICLNELNQLKATNRAIMEAYLTLLCPFAPHITEELWHAMGNTTSIVDAPWPELNEEYLKESSVKMAVSFNGKARYTIEVPAGISSEEVQKIALEDPSAAKWTEGKTIAKVIVVPNKIVNIVVK